MKLLILSEDLWNDKLYPNNMMTNWFENFDGQLAHLYLSSGMPDNPCCSEYFQITDWMALKNLVKPKSGGKWFTSNGTDTTKHAAPSCTCISAHAFCEAEVLCKHILHIGLRRNKAHKTGKGSLSALTPMRYFRIKKGIKLIFGGVLRLLRDAVWLKTDWKRSLLMEFLKEFKPDIIFSLRFSSRKVLYMERILHSVTGVPVVAFTGDDEYSLRQINLSPFYWIRRILLRRDISRNAAFYSKYYTLSEMQAKEFRKALGVESSVLYKGGDFTKALEEKKLSKPIQMVYAGRLYCNRDKTLLSIARAIARINREEVKITLEIYSRDRPGRRVRDAFNDGRSVFFKGFVSAEILRRIYKETDIVLLAESFDLRNRLLTKYSFSTKTIDCLASTCAVIAVGPLSNEGIRYLKKNRGAICIGKKEEIYPVLSHIVSHPDKIEVCRRNAWRLGIKAHRKEEIRQCLHRDIAWVVKNVSVSNRI